MRKLIQNGTLSNEASANVFWLIVEKERGKEPFPSIA
jgi:hypothetical protein